MFMLGNEVLTREQGINIVREVTIPWLISERLDSFSEIVMIHQQLAETDSEYVGKNGFREAIATIADIQNPLLAPIIDEDGSLHNPLFPNLLHLQGGDTRFIGEKLTGEQIFNSSKFNVFNVLSGTREIPIDFLCPEIDPIKLWSELSQEYDTLVHDLSSGTTDKEDFARNQLPYLVTMYRVLFRLIHPFDGANNRSLNEWTRLQFLKFGVDIDLQLDPNTDHNLSLNRDSYGQLELDLLPTIMGIYEIPGLHDRGSIPTGFYDIGLRPGLSDTFIPAQRKVNLSIQQYHEQLRDKLRTEIGCFRQSGIGLITGEMQIETQLDRDRVPILQRYYTGGRMLSRLLR
jgi:hypothetical protein